MKEEFNEEDSMNKSSVVSVAASAAVVTVLSFALVACGDDSASTSTSTSDLHQTAKDVVAECRNDVYRGVAADFVVETKDAVDGAEDAAPVAQMYEGEDGGITVVVENVMLNCGAIVRGVDVSMAGDTIFAQFDIDPSSPIARCICSTRISFKIEKEDDFSRATRLVLGDLGVFELHASGVELASSNSQGPESSDGEEEQSSASEPSSSETTPESSAAVSSSSDAEESSSSEESVKNPFQVVTQIEGDCMSARGNSDIPGGDGMALPPHAVITWDDGSDFAVVSVDHMMMSCKRVEGAAGLTVTPSILDTVVVTAIGDTLQVNPFIDETRADSDCRCLGEANFRIMVEEAFVYASILVLDDNTLTLQQEHYIPMPTESAE